MKAIVHSSFGMSLNYTLDKQVEIWVDNFDGIIAIWHDESQINRYLIDNKPKVLDSSYCYPEYWQLPFEKKLLALDKNHSEIRS